MPERRRRDERAEPDVRNLGGDRAEADEGFRGPGPTVAAAEGEHVVGAEEGGEAAVVGRLGNCQQVAIGRPLLGLGEDAQIHDRQAIPRDVGDTPAVWLTG